MAVYFYLTNFLEMYKSPAPVCDKVTIDGVLTDVHMVNKKKFINATEFQVPTKLRRIPENKKLADKLDEKENTMCRELNQLQIFFPDTRVILTEQNKNKYNHCSKNIVTRQEVNNY